MLQRARLTQQQQQTNTCDTNSAAKQSIHAHSPVQLAKSWGTPIWTPEYTLRYLEKVAIALGLHKSPLAANHHQHTNTNHKNNARNLLSPAAPSGSHLARSSPRPTGVTVATPTRPANTKRLRGEYIKIEASDRNYRPYYKEFKFWPIINLSSVPGFCPFAHEPIVRQPPPPPQPPAPISPSARTMTRKSRNSKTNRSTTATTVAAAATASVAKPADSPPPAPTSDAANKCGYCEICHIEYDALATHLQSKEHQNFVKNGDNFLSLDSLISNSANVQTFLSANRAPPAKSDRLDDGLFGKRTAGKKVGKLFRVTDDIKLGASDDHLPTMGNRLNGVLSNGLSSSSPPTPKVLTMVTRRSTGSRRTADGASSVDGRKRRTSKAGGRKVKHIVPMVVDDPEEDEEEDGENMMDVDVVEVKKEIEDEESNSEGEQPKPTHLHASTDGGKRARRESAKRINYAEPREDDENVVVASEMLVTKSKKIEKLRLRSIRWRPPSQEERSGMSQPFYKVVDETTSTTTTRVGVKHQRSAAHQSSSRLAAGEASRRSKESLSETNGECVWFVCALLIYV